MSEEKPAKFPGIAPPDVVIPSTFRVYLSEDFQKEEDLEELTELMFDEPECEFQYFKEVESPLIPLLYRAQEVRDILLGKYEDYFYKRPNTERSFVHIPPHDAERLSEDVKEFVAGQRYLRVSLKLSERKRRFMGAHQIADVGRQSDSNPLELKPNFFGLGVDLTKGFRWIKNRFKKK